MGMTASEAVAGGTCIVRRGLGKPVDEGMVEAVEGGRRTASGTIGASSSRTWIYLVV